MPNTKNIVQKFALANKMLREGCYEDSVNMYRELIAEKPIKIYKDNLQQALRLASSACSSAAPDQKSPSRRPSILFVTAGLLGPTPGGGIATCFHNMVKAVSENSDAKIDIVYVAHPYYGRGNRQTWVEYYLKNFGARLLTLDINKKNYGSEEMRRSQAVDEYLASVDGLYDTVVFHDFMGLGYYALLSKKYGLSLQYARVVISAHGNHELSYHFGSKKVSKWAEAATMFMERMALGLADVVTTPSQYYADWLCEKFKVKSARHIPNIIYKDERKAEDIQINLAPSLPTVVFYGRMERLKGVDTLLQSAALLSERGIAMNIVFAGNSTKIDGVDAAEYIQEKLKGSAHVFHFIVNTTPKMIFEFCKKAKCVAVYPTLGETSSCVAVESIIYDAPFVASDIPGIKELIADEHHSDVLFEAGSPEGLADSLVSAFQKRKVPSLSFDMSENCKRWATFLIEFPERFSPVSRLHGSAMISVIVPTCDRPELLSDAIDSLQYQTYRNLEIIVVDDASVEWQRNEEICAQKGVRYQRLTSKAYKGRACNTAAELANGEFICFFDDDDMAKPEMLETYVRAFAADPSLDVLSCFADYFEHAGWQRGSEIKREYVSLSLGGSLETNLLANFFGKGTFIVRTEKFFQMGGYECDFDSVPMVDFRFYIKAFLSGLKISTVPRALYHYRKNSPNSLFYKNKDNRRMLYLAKKSIEEVLIGKCGEGVGKSLGHLVWNVGLPVYE
ncbi:glycosyltransferase [Azohydromonas australica]|uniref:glycosyltransferase n=1 Tax=Azohydromonas australica TaxID=364039 RepID=UPI00040E9A73|nr:glycosyltransferase [Azohydromonas australica]